MNSNTNPTQTKKNNIKWGCNENHKKPKYWIQLISWNMVNDILRLYHTNVIVSATSFGSSTSTIWIGIGASDAQHWIAWCMQTRWFCCGRSRQWRQWWQWCAWRQISQWATTVPGDSVVANDATVRTHRRWCQFVATSMEDFTVFRWQLNWYIWSWSLTSVFVFPLFD